MLGSEALLLPSQNLSPDGRALSRLQGWGGPPWEYRQLVKSLRLHLAFLGLQFVVLLYSFLRKAAWDYGRLALLIHNDR